MYSISTKLQKSIKKKSQICLPYFVEPYPKSICAKFQISNKRQGAANLATSCRTVVSEQLRWLSSTAEPKQTNKQTNASESCPTPVQKAHVLSDPTEVCWVITERCCSLTLHLCWLLASWHVEAIVDRGRPLCPCSTVNENISIQEVILDQRPTPLHFPILYRAPEIYSELYQSCIHTS